MLNSAITSGEPQNQISQKQHHFPPTQYPMNYPPPQYPPSFNPQYSLLAGAAVLRGTPAPLLLSFRFHQIQAIELVLKQNL